MPACVAASSSNAGAKKAFITAKAARHTAVPITLKER